MSDSTPINDLPSTLTPIQREVLERLLIRHFIESIPPRESLPEEHFNRFVWITIGILALAVWFWSRWQWSMTSLCVIGGLALISFCGNLAVLVLFVRDHEQYLKKQPTLQDREDRICREVPKKTDADLLVDYAIMKAKQETELGNLQNAHVILKTSSSLLAFAIFLMTLAILIVGFCALNPNREAHFKELIATQRRAKDIRSVEDIEYRSIGVASFSFKASDLPSDRELTSMELDDALSIGLLNTVWRLKEPK